MNGPGLLSAWARWGWIAVYAVVVVVHLSHATAMDGRRRAWHAGHVVMALGMVEMFLPRGLKIASDVAGEVVFGAVAAVVLVWMVRRFSSARPVNLLWVVSLLDMAAMVYMFGFPGAAVAPLTSVLVVYYAGVVVAWMGGAFDDDDDRNGVLSFAVGPRSSPVSLEPLAGATSVGERTTLGAMAAGMAYMFVAMQIGL